jgi:integrase
VRLGYETWQRAGDIRRVSNANLTTAVVDGLRVMMFRLEQQKTGNLVEQYDLPPAIMAILDRPGASIVNSYTKQPYGEDAFQKRFRFIARKAGLPDSLQFRDLRRTGATEALDQGETTARVMSAGGWASAETVHRHYGNRTAKQAAAALGTVRVARAKRAGA